eukprot:COSAG01_NODE_18462_length_1074_cov_1.596923_1_plen_90_part_01
MGIIVEAKTGAGAELPAEQQRLLKVAPRCGLPLRLRRGLDLHRRPRRMAAAHERPARILVAPAAVSHGSVHARPVSCKAQPLTGFVLVFP